MAYPFAGDKTKSVNTCIYTNSINIHPSGLKMPSILVLQWIGVLISSGVQVSGKDVRYSNNLNMTITYI